MKMMYSLLATTLLSLTLFAAPALPTFEGAQWIWDKEAEQKAGTWHFQKGFDFPAGEKPKTAQIIVTCDNQWVLYVNGKRVGENNPGPDSWRHPKVIDLSKQLIIEQNAIAIEGVNTIPGPAGLLVKLAVTF
jgi:hypothetical protein